MAREWFVHPLTQWTECDADYVDAFIEAFLKNARANAPEYPAQNGLDGVQY